MKTALSFLVAALALAGCSTPRPVLEQANHTAALAAQLEIEMKRFARVQKAAAQARLRSIAQQEADIEFVAGQARLDAAARAANGDTSTDRLQAKLLDMAALTGEVDARSSSAAGLLQAQLKELMKPLPSTADKLAATQKALAEMGTELPASTRLAELKSFYSALKAGVDANRKKIDEAEAAARKSEKE